MSISGDYEYEVSSGSAIIFQYIGAGGNITIPPILGGYSVIGIYHNAFNGCTTLTGVTILESMVFIGYYAFAACINLHAVYFLGNAPNMLNGVFENTAADFTVYYLNGRTGYTNPWHGYSTEPFFTVAYNGNGNSSGFSPVDSNHYRLGDNITVLGNPGALAKTDSAFAGWNTQADGAGTTYMPGQTFPMPSANVTLYAVFVYNYEYTVSGGNAIIKKNWGGLIGDFVITSILDVYPVTGIDREAFSDSNLLTSVIIPSSITSIGPGAFMLCSLLDAAYFLGDEPAMDDTAFLSAGLNFKIYYPNGKPGYTNPWHTYPTEPFYSMIYDGNGNTRGNPPIDYNPHIQRSNVTVLGNIGSLSITNWHFTAWNTQADGTGTTYLPGQSLTMPSGNVTLYAVYASDFMYTVSGSDAIITKYIGAGGNITIPSILDGYTVTGIGDYVFYNNASVTGMTISSGVAIVGAFTFAYCTNLISLKMPGSITSIGDCAFAHCSSLPGVKIPNNLTSLGNYLFAYCAGFSHVTIPAGVISLGNYAFAYCTGLTSVTIPASVTSIGDYAFTFCANLPRVTIPDSVTRLGDHAFAYCASLGSVTISHNLTALGSHVFAYCTSLPGITIPDSVTSIGENAFIYCTSLPSVTIPGSISSIGNGAFQFCASLISAHFTGNAPALEPVVFLGTSLNFKIYYNTGATGFTNPWYGYQTEAV